MAKQSTRVSIWANFEGHAKQLRDLGATERDVDELRQAAQAVDDADAAAAKSPVDPAIASAPVVVAAFGWTIPPATKEARAWARRALLCVTGGREAAPGIGQLLAIVAGLWALHQVGAGKLDDVMQAVSGRGRLATIVSELVDELTTKGLVTHEALSRLAEDYARAMGFSMPPQLAGAVSKYTETMEQIAVRVILQSTAAASRKASSPRNGSTSRGTTSGAASRPPSSMPSSKSRRYVRAPAKRR